MPRPRGSQLKSKNKQTTLTSPLQQNLSSSLPSPLRHDDSDGETVCTMTGDIATTIELVKKNISKELERLQRDFNKSIEDLHLTIDNLKEEHATLTEKYCSLGERVKQLEEDRSTHTSLLNNQERFSRRNNVRLVGVKASEGENCLELAKTILEEAGVPSCKIERAHRNGKFVHGRDRHLLVKLSFYQDKITVLKNSRQALASKPYYVIEDLTQTDLKEKRKWGEKVQHLYQNGTRLRFSGGLWRGRDGKPYNFTDS